MSPERWRQIEELYYAAQGCGPSERAALLETSDSEIRSRVERMLAQESGGQILDEPATFLLEPSAETLWAEGSRQGPYEIQAQIGSGGMGTVYRALDTRLGRLVAIKVVKASYGERLEREARAISALNHPHICTLYDMGPNYLVMELLAGDMLNARIRCGKLPLEQVLQYGQQIASALGEAHARGIIHRDLKPGNIMFTETGMKVLDFGLAKVASPALQSLTESHAVMGTPAYMAPEQVRGEHAGPAADLFALGLVLYEMAEGRLPVPGVSLASAWTSGTTVEIPPLSDRSRTARGLSKLIWQLLELAPERRPGSAAEVRDRLDRLAADLAVQPGRKRAPLVAALMALISVAGAGIWWSEARNVSSSPSLTAAGVSKLTSFPGDENDPAVSPDGRSVAFSWNGETGDNFDIYVMPLRGEMAVRLTRDPARDISPAWSPDGSQIAFLRLRTVSKGDLVVVPSGGGPERVLREIVLREDIYRALRPLLTWTPDGSGIVYTTLDTESGRAGLYLAALQGPATRQLLSAAEGTLGNTSPAFTRDGKWLAYTEAYGPYHSRLFVRPVTAGFQFRGEPIRVSGQQDTLIGSPVWSPNGKRLLYTRDKEIVEWHPSGRSEQIYVGTTRLTGMSAAWRLQEKPRIVTSDRPRQELRSVHLRQGGLVVSGEPVAFGNSAGSRGNPQFAPDGKRIVFVDNRSGAFEVWVADANSQNSRQLTHLNSTLIGFPHWSADSKRIAFHSWTGNQPQIFTCDLEPNLSEPSSRKQGNGAKQISNANFGAISPVWSVDGTFLYFSRIAGSRIFRIPATGGPIEEVFDGSGGMVTPGGHRFVYFKIGHPGIFSRSLDGDPATNPEEKLVDDYKPPGDDLNPFMDGVYYISWNGDGQRRSVRFYSYAQKKSSDVFILPGPVGSPQDLAVSPDRSQMVYHQLSGLGTDLSIIEFE
jgi:eukaryotic-like serine/threonine-protein kinase